MYLMVKSLKVFFVGTFYQFDEYTEFSHCSYEMKRGGNDHAL